MADLVPVAPADVRVVAEVFRVAAQAFGASLVAIPGFGDALEACGRLTAAADAALLPRDPVSGPEKVAIAHHHMLTAYENAGFDHEEAFAIVHTYIATNASAAAMRHAHE